MIYPASIYPVMTHVLLAAMLFTRTLLAPGVNLYSPEEDIAIGREAAPQFEKRLQLSHDAQLNRYVSDVGRKLAAVAPHNFYPFTFKVIRDKRINAFALPGGPVYINSGTIERADNESQLAGVIAHEIAHVVLRHSTATASKARIAQGGLALIGRIFQRSIVTTGVALTLASAFLHYSRQNETEADLLGAQMVYDSKQWNPLEMTRFFEKIQHEIPGQTVEFFSDHPDPGNRVESVAREVQGLGAPHQARAASPEFAEFSKMQRVAAEMDRDTSPPRGPEAEPGRDARADARSSDAPAPVALKPFNGRGYRVSYPNNWELREERFQTRIVLASPDRSAGAVVGTFNVGEGLSLDASTRRFVDMLRRQNPDWRMNGVFHHLEVGGLPGQSAVMEAASGEVDWVTTALRPDGALWYAVFIADERDFSRLRPVFQQMMDSVRLAN